MSARHSVLATAYLLVIVACASDADSWAGTMESLPGGGIIVRNPAEGLWDDNEVWSLEPELRIGRIDGEGPDLFGRIGGLAVDGQNRIWVLEGQAREIRVFDADGRHVRTIGRAGQGPGEFAQPWSLSIDARGNVWVSDAGNARYTRFDSAGTLVEERPRETRMFGPTGGGVLADGRYVDLDIEANVSPLMAAAGIGRSQRVLRTMFVVDSTAQTAATDTFLFPPATQTFEPFVATLSGGGRMAVGVPFAPRMVFALDPAGAVWWGESGSYRLFHQSLTGDTLMIIERKHTPIAVTSDDIAAWDTTNAPRRLREAGGRIDHSRIPTTKPVFENLLIDEAGYVWVDLIHAGNGRQYDVFDDGGRYLGGVAAPEGFQSSPAPVIRGPHVFAVVRDSLDVPYVIRFRVRNR